MLRSIITATVVVIVVMLAYSGGTTVLSAYVFKEDAPVQPINFSHKIHATDNEIPCQQCHIYARRSRSSGVPPIERCMGCHATVRTDSPEIKKLHEYWNEQKPIPWVKIHNVADYVYFPHKRHIQRGVKCQECHGSVETMARVRREAPMTMGWCLGCHMKKNPPGPSDCWACHI